MMLKKMTEGRDPNTGRFLAGNNGGGRQKGSRNKLAEDFISDLYASWQKNGAAAIERMLAERPAEYVKVVASILPKQLEIKENTFDGISDEQLDQLLAAARTALGIIDAKDVNAARHGRDTAGKHKRYQAVMARLAELISAIKDNAPVWGGGIAG